MGSLILSIVIFYLFILSNEEQEVNLGDSSKEISSPQKGDFSRLGQHLNFLFGIKDRIFF